MNVMIPEDVYWLDCGFYLLPVTSSKLLKYGLTLDDVSVSKPPLKYGTTPTVYEWYTDRPNQYTSRPVGQRRMAEQENSSCSLFSSLGGSMPLLRNLLFG